MDLIQLQSQWNHDSDLPRDSGRVKNATWAQNRALYLSDGWRVKGAVPKVAGGYTRTWGPVWVQDIEDEESATASVIDRLTADIEAEDAAAAAAQAVEDAAELAAFQEMQRDLDQFELTLKAVALVMLSEVNNVREWVAGYKGEVAAATNLGNLQARVAALPNMPERTVQQLRTAVYGKVAELQGT